jgi:hypothetical protein
MTSSPATHARNVVIALLAGLLAILEIAFAWLGSLVWGTRGSGDLATAEAAPFVVLGVSAVVGVFVLLLSMIALMRGARGHRTARFAVTLAWLRVAAVVVCMPILAARIGSAAVIGSFSTVGVVVAIGDALIGSFVAGVSVRRTTPI